MKEQDLTNQEKLEEIYKITLENNHILHKIQNRERITIIIRIVYWLIIIGALGGAYYFISPFIESIRHSSTKADGVLRQFEEFRAQFPETKALQQLFHQGTTSTTQ